MTTPVIIDVIVAVFLLFFTVYGAKQGLLRSLAGLAILIVSLVGAAMIASTFAPPIAEAVSPLVEQRIADRVTAAMEEQTQLPPSEGNLQLAEILERLGLEEELWADLTERVRDAVENTGADIAAALTESLIQSLIYGVLYILSFVLLLILLTVLAKAMGLLTKLPGVRGLNALGGALMGLAKGALVLFLLIWTARRLGVSFEMLDVAQTYLLRFFTTHTPLSVLALLQ